jgi:phosphotransferase system enzyme I (PtsI)/phosphotransferase system enzyme I (PtsP)
LEIFDFYKALLTGDQLLLSAERRIRGGSSAFAAVRESVDEHVMVFDTIEDEYLRARGEDIRHIGNKLLAAMLGAAAPHRATGRVVLLGEMVSIADIGEYRPEQIAGIVCMQGSSLSHTAVLARSLGIPAVVGTGPIDHIHDGMQAIVDGDEAVVVFTPSTPMLIAYNDMIAADRAFEEELLAQKDLPAITLDGTRIGLYANTGLLSDARPDKSRGAEGIGLYRSEIPFLTSRTLPTEAEQYAIYRELLELYHPLPVTMRTLDVGGDKQLPYLPIVEDNPTLGWRGIRFALDNPAILATQLRAMVRADAGLGNLSIMLPMVGTVDEVIAVRRMLDDVVESLGEEGSEVARPPLGIMIEIPGIVALLPHVTGVADFLSIGTNDLTQYLLAVDRGNPHVATRYDHLHPAVLRTIADIARFGRRAKLPVSVCGEMAGDPTAVILLVGLGIERLSMSAFSLPRIKALVRSLSREGAARVAKRALGKRDAVAIRASVARAVRNWDLERVVERRTST